MRDIKSKIIYLFSVIISIILGFSFATLASQHIDIGYKKISQEEKIQSIEQKDIAEKYFYFIKNPDKKPVVSAESYFVGDIDTGEIILEKNKDVIYPIASISKLFTAIVSLEEENKETNVTMSKEILKTEGQNGGFYINENIKKEDLLYPLLLESSNDAAEGIASANNRENFINKMNEKAKTLNLESTYFEDPSGLSEFNRSTTQNLFTFSQYLKKYYISILDLTTEKSLKKDKHTWFNNSQFLNLEGYIGGKRGYINEAKQTALSVFSLPIGNENRNIGIAILRSNDRYKDTQNILNFLKNNIYYGTEKDADMDWTKQKDGVLEEKEPNFVNILLGGDIMLDRGVRSSVNKNFNGDYSLMFDKLDILKTSDINFANLEGPASNKGVDRHNLYSFRMDPSIIPALKGANINIVSMANNHIGDWGMDAFTDTLDRLTENEIKYTGAGTNYEEAKKPKIIEKYNMKIGFLGFSDVGPNNMNAKENTPGILLANDPNFENIIKQASEEVDFLIVSFHFGDEYKTVHNQRQEYLAHKAIDNGAKIIVGHHPHVIQDTEIYKNGFIIYSLGNFIFDQYFSENTMQGGLYEIKLWRNGDIDINKNIVKLDKTFQPIEIKKGKLENIKFTSQ